ncbi:MAG: AmmeMemoRadiSam system radical SAM enzyme [Candidatus Pacebacteria bacterium]|nr:AmmeMemoRadiSam system radical SAM enzyme [Candidatus Paceibacterota bacterium]
MTKSCLYKKLDANKVQCQTCYHYCVLNNGQRGKCGARENRNGVLYFLYYGQPCALAVDPIEKKPLFHFLPGTATLSLATYGCNLECVNCQNWTISQEPKNNPQVDSQANISPKMVIEMAKEHFVPSLSYTYTEPTIFLEYALDIMKLAKASGLKNIWVSNGYFSPQTFELIQPYLDAINVDLKGFDDEFYQKYCGARLQPVLDNLKKLKQAGIWMEITTLAIPTLTDSPATLAEIAKFIQKELGEETPWHISQFSGAISWRLKNLPDTKAETLKMAWEIGKKVGLKYVYTGNVPGLDSENTYCPKCHAKMIERVGYAIKRFDKEGACSKCNTNLNLILK